MCYQKDLMGKMECLVTFIQDFWQMNSFFFSSFTFSCSSHLTGFLMLPPETSGLRIFINAILSAWIFSLNQTKSFKFLLRHSATTWHLSFPHSPYRKNDPFFWNSLMLSLRNWDDLSYWPLLQLFMKLS